MVEKIAPHEYFKELSERGGSRQLQKVITKVNQECAENNVLPVYTLNHLSVISKIPLFVTKDIIFDHSKYYTRQKVAKRSSPGFRTIYAPKFPLKQLQRAILSNCLPNNGQVGISYAFQKGSNAISACRQHLGARGMVKLDVANFYGSISTPSIYRIFHSLGYPELMSIEMALICSVGQVVEMRPDDQSGKIYKIKKRGRLTQGSPASGLLSNIHCRKLDRTLELIARDHGAIVTRYADDITFSTQEPMSQYVVNSIIGSSIHALKRQRLNLNRRKTSVIRNGRSFNLLGLRVADDGLHLNSGYKSTVRNHLKKASLQGVSKYSLSLGYSSDLEFIFMLWGHYAYSMGVEKDFAAEISSKLHTLGIPRLTA